MRGYVDLSNNHSKISKSDVKHRNIYLDLPKDRPRTTCLIHAPGKFSDECKILGNFGYKYAKSRPTKDRGNDPTIINKFNRQKENNDIVNHEVD